MASAVFHLFVVVTAFAVAAPNPPDAENVVWTSPSHDSSGSMPLGNGDIGLNLWVEADGDLLFYVSKTDAWDEQARLLKLGRVRLTLNPNPFRSGLPFRQELRLRQGEIQINAGESNAPVALRIWVDANHPVIRVEAESKEPFSLQASVEIWRNEKRRLATEESHGVEGFAKDEPPYSYPDQIVETIRDRIVWYHRNEKSIWPVTLKHQGLAGYIEQASDPLLNRTFGAAMQGDGLDRVNDRTLQSAQPRRRFVVSIVSLTAQTATTNEWLAQLDRSIAEADAVESSNALAAHRRWWDAFWNRSWIRVTGSRGDVRRARPMVRNRLPLRIGADSQRRNRFVGEIGRVAIFDRVLNALEISRRALAYTTSATNWAGLVAEWDFSRRVGEDFVSAGENELKARIIGDVQVLESHPGPGSRSIRLDGRGFLEVPHCAAIDLEDAVTLEAWIRPDSLPPSGARIIDKSEVGSSNGYLLDTYPGHSLRLSVEDGALMDGASLSTNRWTHVAAVFDSRTGEKKLYIDGKETASGGLSAASRPIHQIVSQGYALQRFINACGGRGAYPIKFNGSIFTVEVPGKFDPDFRQWGGCYWFQNTRLPYWPMLASGDFDLMRPLIAMYREALPLAQARTKTYFSHGGAYFPETMYFWGMNANGDLGYGWERSDEPLGRVKNQYIRFYWSGALELTAMMLDYYAATQDEAFFDATLLPLADSILEFYARHYPRRPDGQIRFAPAQALETWWDCVNPMPEVAGLRFVLAQLLALPAQKIGPTRKAEWRKLLEALPPLPVGKTGDSDVLLPAESFQTQRNMENPELYAVFPYRLFGVEKPDLDLARRTFALRRFKGNRGWQQDDTQMAFLGLTEGARTFVANRFATKHPDSRFPAFWGPNFDWVPDQDHGGNAMMALQTMLLQTDGRKILLFPAWPQNWDVEFKLHAPFRTTVEGVYQDGVVTQLKVTPPEREKDLVQFQPHD